MVLLKASTPPASLVSSGVVRVPVIRSLSFLLAGWRSSQQYDDATHRNVRRRPTSQFGALSCRTGEAAASKGVGDTMSTQSEPEDRWPDPSLRAVVSERRRLMNLAYRLLGSLADAEDVVQSRPDNKPQRVCRIETLTKR
jgi:hypothetical protein